MDDELHGIRIEIEKLKLERERLTLEKECAELTLRRSASSSALRDAEATAMTVKQLGVSAIRIFEFIGYFLIGFFAALWKIADVNHSFVQGGLLYRMGWYLPSTLTWTIGCGIFLGMIGPDAIRNSSLSRKKR